MTKTPSFQGALAFQGALGAYSHLACREIAPDAVALPCTDFEAAIAAVHELRADMALLPVENSIAGRVADIHHLLPNSRLHIIAEHFQPIRHCLLALPGANIGDIKTVSSHIHALPQCRDIIRKYGWARHVSSDTAAAAGEVAAKGDASWAAIASSLAGEIYGLQVLNPDISDARNNTTRFLLMSPEPLLPSPNTGPVMTSLIFRVRSVPAALYKALGGFATNGLNLTKIESYLENADFSAAMFYVEVEGHPETESMRHAMAELAFYADGIRILGVYLAHPYRRKLPL
ncbi:MAG: pheA [Alphaproteobacteria bacterium]|nr:pheA [Alphaproteobacteria bacterium]